MKTILLFLTVCFFYVAQGQTVLIPNGGFNTNTSGWSIVGTNITINGGGELHINISGIYTEDFILTSPSFSLDTNKTYKLHGDYKNVEHDPMMGEVELGGFSSILLKDNNGIVVANLALSTCQVGGFLNACYSANFNVNATGIYYLEFYGQHRQGTEFNLDNVGFEEVIENTFSGTITLDENNDGCVSSSTTLANFPIQINETTTNTSYNMFTDTNGMFTVETQNTTGNFVTQINQPFYNSSPGNYTNIISSGTNTITNQDFCVTENAVANDLNVSIIPTTEARPGFNTSYQIRYTNLGTTTLSGVVSLNFDQTKVTYLNGSIVPDVINAASLSWNYFNLMPYEVRSIDVNFNVFTPPTVNNGDVLSYTATITPISGDFTPLDNNFSFNQITIGSYDPNDITILEGPFITANQANDYLNVMIRFQNTGTASAINIVVKNTLDPFLDWSSFRPIAASHNYAVTIRNDNAVDFVFNGIHLADSTTDEPGSHGWIFYKIKPKNTFSVGDVIANTAHIYFDYNLPIITNTATTQIDTTLGLETNSNVKNTLAVYPNPIHNELIVSIKNEATFNLINTKGQILIKGELEIGENLLNVSSLAEGLYFIEIKRQNETVIKKIIK